MYKGFLSDNCAGVLPEIMLALCEENKGFDRPYGHDKTTAEAKEVLKQHIGDAEVFFVLTGTGANVISIASSLKSFQGIVCPETAHINVDECGAPEKFSGCKLLTVPSHNGRLDPADIDKYAHSIGFEHHSQPSMVSISQATEAGTLYTQNEIKAIAEAAHSRGMYLHMDGARVVNAVCATGISIREISGGCGVDVLSLGGTKAGLMMGEAVVFFNRKLAENILYTRKQAMQLLAKSRFIAAQYKRFFQDDLWKRSARHANAMAELLGQKLSEIDGVTLSSKPEVNAVFASLPRHAIDKMLEKYGFYIWNEQKNEIRLMTSFATTEEEIEAFVSDLKKVM
jgi:threonine aldolase